ncbi:MAG TPA: murein biosynthesis integral membrane protein MurJ, partial [Firmicutes bacterium]|nr:murein biosynthesis integral membrane protein MurJ [Bacillota bacterium]
QLPVGIFVTALATAIYPTLAEYAGRGDKAGLANAAGSGVRLLSLVMLPAAVGL